MIKLYFSMTFADFQWLIQEKCHFSRPTKKFLDFSRQELNSATFSDMCEPYYGCSVLKRILRMNCNHYLPVEIFKDPISAVDLFLHEVREGVFTQWLGAGRVPAGLPGERRTGRLHVLLLARQTTPFAGSGVSGGRVAFWLATLAGLGRVPANS